MRGVGWGRVGVALLLLALCWASPLSGDSEEEGRSLRRRRNAQAGGVQSIASVMGWALIQIAICVCCFLCFRKLCARRSGEEIVLASAQPRAASYPTDDSTLPYQRPSSPSFFTGESGNPHIGVIGPWGFVAPGQEGPKFDVAPPTYAEAMSFPPPNRLPPIQTDTCPVTNDEEEEAEEDEVDPPSYEVASRSHTPHSASSSRQPSPLPTPVLPRPSSSTPPSWHPPPSSLLPLSNAPNPPGQLPDHPQLPA